MEKPKDLKTEKNDENLTADTLIQVGPWAYPLIKGRSTIMRNAMGIYVVPNPTNDHPSNFYNLIGKLKLFILLIEVTFKK